MKNELTKREAAIMASLDGLQPAEVPPYFYTRLLARMQNELVKKKEPLFLFRPAFLTASLSLVLIVNIVFLVQSKVQHRSPSSQRSDSEATIESFADAYNLNTTAVYE